MLWEGGFPSGGAPLPCSSRYMRPWLDQLDIWQQYAAEALRRQPETLASEWFCSVRVTPVGLGACIALSLLLCSILASLFAPSRWTRQHNKSSSVSAARKAMKQLREQHLDQNPPVPHSWFAMSSGDLVRPLSCGVCVESIQPKGVGKDIQCCEVCGMLAHDSCHRRARRHCKPVALQADTITHAWRPAGVIMPTSEEDDLDPPTQSCHYCREACETDLLSGEPVWVCIRCQAVAHVQCYQRTHPGVSTAKALRSDSVPDGASADGGDDPRTDVEGASECESQSAFDDGGSPMACRHPAMRWRGPSPEQLDCKENLIPGSTLLSAKSAGLANGLGSGAAYSTPLLDPAHQLEQQWSGSSRALSEEHWQPSERVLSAALEPITEQRPGRSLVRVLSNMLLGPDASQPPDEHGQLLPSPAIRQANQADVAQLDLCTLGSHGKLVLPATSVQWKEDESVIARVKNHMYSGGSKRKGNSQQLRSQSWWGLHKETRWDDFKIGEVPTGFKPILVFINTKSGPQQGWKLRRKFLRLLNPLQVVELPREKPEDALRLFADVPNLRLLVVGGDGTVGWVLSCVDRLAEARKKAADATRQRLKEAAQKATAERQKAGQEGAAAEKGMEAASRQDSPPQPEPVQDWKQPPIAILPLGTGNDLARVLNWGGNLGAALQGGSLSELLQAVYQSTPAMLDRWDVKIKPTEPPKRRVPLTGSPAVDEPSVKAMNNYLGIGIDAKVALEFHKWRDQFPGWFQSQFGNKLIYTGAGAADIVLSSRLNLPDNIQVECDGDPIQLPRDIEGILVLNIPSYMGGVDLWGSGLPADGSARHQSRASPDDSAKQSFCDKRLELMAVYGSWHLGQLQVGLSQARRLCRCSRVRITTARTLPMQVDGEPWQQAAAVLEVDFKAQAMMLHRLASAPLARMAHTVEEVLESAEAKGVISAAQRETLRTELAARLLPSL